MLLMPHQHRYEELLNSPKVGLKEKARESFYANRSCRFAFKILLTATGLTTSDHAELKREFTPWTLKIM